MVVQQLEGLDMVGGSSEKLSASGFFNHVFNFDTETKSNLMNITQYLVLAIIPMSF